MILFEGNRKKMQLISAKTERNFSAFTLDSKLQFQNI